MTSHKQGNNNGSVREVKALSFTINRDIAAEHLRDSQR